MERKSLYGDSQSSPSRFWDDDGIDDIGSKHTPTTSTSRATPHARKRVIGLSKPRASQQTAIPSSDLNRARTPGRKAIQEKAESRPGSSTLASQESFEGKSEKAASSKSAKDTSVKSRKKRLSPEILESLAPFPLSTSDDELDSTTKVIDEDVLLQAEVQKAKRAKEAGQPAKKGKTKGGVLPLVPKQDISKKPRKAAGGKKTTTRQESPLDVRTGSDGERGSSPDPLALTDDDSPDRWYLSPPRLPSPVQLESFPLSQTPVKRSIRTVSPASSAGSGEIVCRSQDDFPEPFPLSPQTSTPRRRKATNDLSSPLARKTKDADESPGWARRRECSIVDLSDSTPKRNTKTDLCSPLASSRSLRSRHRRESDESLPARGRKSVSQPQGKKRKSPETAGVVVLVSEDDSDIAIAGPSTPTPRIATGSNRRTAAAFTEPSNSDDLSLQGDPDAYHATWTCQYCDKYMPVHMSEDLHTRYIKLKDLSDHAQVSKSDPLSWQQTLDFCAAHEAEATIVPKGIKAGYPSEIDFKRLVERLEAPWLRQRLASIARNPGRSRLFRRAEEDVRQVGRLAWRGATHQQTDRVRASTRAGYYGELGRTIILQHLQRLLEWRCFPSLLPGKDGSPPACAPFLPNDFFVHVLVPEAAILLIMEDHHGTDNVPPTDFAAAKTAAKRLWKESGEYGVWRFREDDEDGERVIRQLQDDKDEIERMVRGGRAASLAEKRKNKQNRQTAVQVDLQSDQRPTGRGSPLRQKQYPDAIVISDTTSESAFSDTSADTLELDTIGKGEVLESPLRFKHLVRAAGSQNDTPRPSRASQMAQASQASSSFGDSFGEEAFILVDEAQALHSKRRKS